MLILYLIVTEPDISITASALILHCIIDYHLLNTSLTNKWLLFKPLFFEYLELLTIRVKYC